ncbi:MAG: hypothetical protein ACE15C_01715 [Phycisphaerae bacterium]
MLDERQYEDLARSLDGEDVSLTAEQSAARDEIAGAEDALAAALDVRMPAGVLGRVRARMEAASQPAASERELLLGQTGGRRVIRIGPWLRAAGALAAAAVIVLAAVVGWRVMFNTPAANNNVVETPTATPAPNPDQLALLTLPAPIPEDKTLGLLAREMDEVAGEMLTPPVPAPIDVEIEVIQHGVDDLRLGAPLGGPAEMPGPE